MVLLQGWQRIRFCSALLLAKAQGEYAENKVDIDFSVISQHGLYLL
jgi:hypothetical protein